MKITKKRRLEAAGWTETSVKEFLDLSKADIKFIEIELALSRRFSIKHGCFGDSERATNRLRIPL